MRAAALLQSGYVSDAFLFDAHQPSTRWPLPSVAGAQYIIGREAPAELVVAAAPVSRRHASITFRDSCHWLHDLGSRNGTFVNGRVVGANPVRLIDGDEIVLGGAAALRFSDPTQTAKSERIGQLRGVWLNENGDTFINAVRVDPPLSAAQIALLRLLFDARGGYVARSIIANAVWPADDPAGISEEAINGLIKRLRARLRDASAGVDFIEQARSRGVRLRIDGN